MLFAVVAILVWVPVLVLIWVLGSGSVWAFGLGSGCGLGFLLLPWFSHARRGPLFSPRVASGHGSGGGSGFGSSSGCGSGFICRFGGSGYGALCFRTRV